MHILLDKDKKKNEEERMKNEELKGKIKKTNKSRQKNFQRKRLTSTRHALQYHSKLIRNNSFMTGNVCHLD